MKHFCPQCATEMTVEDHKAKPQVLLCPKCVERFEIDPTSRKAVLAPLTLGQMLADVRRALDQCFPDRALEIMTELEARMVFDLDTFGPPPNVVIVARFSQDPTPMDQAFVQKILLQHNVTNAVLFLGPGETLQTANRAALRAAGLRRLEVDDAPGAEDRAMSALAALTHVMEQIGHGAHSVADNTRALNEALACAKKVLES